MTVFEEENKGKRIRPNRDLLFTRYLKQKRSSELTELLFSIFSKLIMPLQ